MSETEFRWFVLKALKIILAIMLYGNKEIIKERTMRWISMVDKRMDSKDSSWIDKEYNKMGKE